MTITINPKDFGHDGQCDNEGDFSPDCDRPAVAAVLSATPPDMWTLGAPAASIAFLCADHLDAEPIAHREHAEHNARGAEGGSRRIWQALLDSYPNPIPLIP
ncbi:hypothetical protein IMZ11_33830 [Microtetraspora sp. AC03309]|uniref:hypothetical protein n=1 Tax=Microtetraspora sp. AC03309 TaxID=2779376 RepID=UPI001E4ECB7E|nr:hypothetical protein [Microtetraspora sp. AC03309]MCC5580610.1 hypothetical protein [Microtetraspora sp. AC03309]